MGDVAIRVEGLSKRYRIQQGARAPYGTLRDALVEAVRAPFRRRPSHDAAGNDSYIWALKDVSFEVKQGEVVGIIGRNGAGKTTLLKILSRITEPTEGYAELRGRVGTLLEVGTGFHPELTGRENIYLSGAILGMKKAEIDRKFDEIVAFAEMEKFIDTPVKFYSSGMYVRLAFAVAAHLDPEILLVDEVLAVGDAAFQRKCLGKMGEVAQEGRTVLFVSHNMSAIINLCKRCLLLVNGYGTFYEKAADAITDYLATIPQQQNGFADLSLHPGRPPNMKPVIRSIGLRSSESIGYTGVVKAHENLIFEIGYECGDLILNYAVIGICSYLGERVLTVGTHLDPEFNGTLRGKGVLECWMPCVPLAEGDYRVMVAVGTTNPFRNVDYVEDAMSFRVETGDYFGTGRTLLPGQGYILQRSRWRIKEQE
jgi:lipopolysaccharide transport system ATP-binding protein